MAILRNNPLRHSRLTRELADSATSTFQHPRYDKLPTTQSYKSRYYLVKVWKATTLCLMYLWSKRHWFIWFRTNVRFTLRLHLYYNAIKTSPQKLLSSNWGHKHPGKMNMRCRFQLPNTLRFFCAKFSMIKHLPLQFVHRIRVWPFHVWSLYHALTHMTKWEASHFPVETNIYKVTKWCQNSLSDWLEQHLLHDITTCIVPLDYKTTASHFFV